MSSHAAAAGQPLLQRASALPDPAIFHHAAFVPPGYGSLLFAHLYENNSCPLGFPGSVFTQFRAWVRESLQLPLQLPSAAPDAPLKVLPTSKPSGWACFHLVCWGVVLPIPVPVHKKVEAHARVLCSKYQIALRHAVLVWSAPSRILRCLLKPLAS